MRKKRKRMKKRKKLMMKQLKKRKNTAMMEIIIRFPWNSWCYWNCWLSIVQYLLQLFLLFLISSTMLNTQVKTYLKIRSTMITIGDNMLCWFVASVFVLSLFLSSFFIFHAFLYLFHMKNEVFLSKQNLCSEQIIVKHFHLRKR